MTFGLIYFFCHVLLFRMDSKYEAPIRFFGPISLEPKIVKLKLEGRTFYWTDLGSRFVALLSVQKLNSSQQSPAKLRAVIRESISIRSALEVVNIVYERAKKKF